MAAEQHPTCMAQVLFSPGFPLVSPQSLNSFRLSMQGISEKMQGEAKLIQGTSASLPELMAGHGGENYSLADSCFIGEAGVSRTCTGTRKK